VSIRAYEQTETSKRTKAFLELHYIDAEWLMGLTAAEAGKIQHSRSRLTQGRVKPRKSVET